MADVTTEVDANVSGTDSFIPELTEHLRALNEQLTASTQNMQSTTEAFRQLENGAQAVSSLSQSTPGSRRNSSPPPTQTGGGGGGGGTGEGPFDAAAADSGDGPGFSMAQSSRRGRNIAADIVNAHHRDAKIQQMEIPPEVEQELRAVPYL